LYRTEQLPLPLVIVMMADPIPLPEQLPDPVMATGRPEEELAATLNIVL
jgi:hypothetical protein